MRRDMRGRINRVPQNVCKEGCSSTKLEGKRKRGGGRAHRHGHIDGWARCGFTALSSATQLRLVLSSQYSLLAKRQWVSSAPWRRTGQKPRLVSYSTVIHHLVTACVATPGGNNPEAGPGVVHTVTPVLVKLQLQVQEKQKQTKQSKARTERNDQCTTKRPHRTQVAPKR